jgi:hypothetical protein
MAWPRVGTAIEYRQAVQACLSGAQAIMSLPLSAALMGASAPPLQVSMHLTVRFALLFAVWIEHTTALHRALTRLVPSP